MTHLINHHVEPRSALASLRALIPIRDSVTFPEALRIAELHANRLLALHDVSDSPTPNEVITELPKVRVEYIDAPVSGASFWNGRHWIIQLNRYEPWTRRRFTLAHECKHIIDHGHVDRLYHSTARFSVAEQAEYAADYFAGCLLLPRRLLKRAWGNHLQRPRELASYFRVSEQAVMVRLVQVGLIDRATRCKPPRVRVRATTSPPPHSPRFTSEPQGVSS